LVQLRQKSLLFYLIAVILYEKSDFLATEDLGLYFVHENLVLLLFVTELHRFPKSIETLVTLLYVHAILTQHD